MCVSNEKKFEELVEQKKHNHLVLLEHLSIDCLVHLPWHCPVGYSQQCLASFTSACLTKTKKISAAFAACCAYFLFTTLDIQLKGRSNTQKKKKKDEKRDKTMRVVCKHQDWKLFTSNIWQLGNNNKICSQNSRAVCNQKVCVFIVYIIHLTSWSLWRQRVRNWFLEAVCLSVLF